MASCLERPIDVCCQCCLLDGANLETRECCCQCCEPFRRQCDYRLTWKRPFVVCALFGCCFGIIPSFFVLFALLLSFLTSGDLNRTINTTNCLLAVFWSIMQAIFCIVNFLFAYWMFKELRKPQEEYEFAFSRDMNELFHRYQANPKVHLIRQMKQLDEQHRIHKARVAAELEEWRKEVDEIKTELAIIKTQSSLGNNKKAAETVELKNKLKELESLIAESSNTDKSLISRLTRMLGSSPACASLMGLVLLGFGWSILGSMFLKNAICNNPILMLSCRMMLYADYVFVIIGVGVCFCNTFSASEISRIEFDNAEIDDLLHEEIDDVPTNKEEDEVALLL